MKDLKVVIIGGGSSYTPELAEGLILNKETLPIGQVVLVDVETGLEKVKINRDLMDRMFQKAGLSVTVSYTLDRRQALVGADFIMSQLRVGGLKARALDETIPLAYGMIGQETTGIGGFFKALRTIPVMLEICRDIEAICPEAWLINFTNPSGIVTEMIQQQTQVKCLGLCNVPINMHYDAAERLRVPPETIQTNFIGLNHLSFMNHCYLEGQDVLPQVLAVSTEEGQVKNIDKLEAVDHLAGEMGLMLSPYLQYFYFERDMFEEERESVAKHKGSRAEQLMPVEAELFDLYSQPTLDQKPKALEQRGGARYSLAAISLVNSLYNDRGDIQVVNTMNQGSITDLPYDAVVEVNAVINGQGAKPIANGPLPQVVAGLVKQVKIYETYTVQAALTGDINKAHLALLNNPLVKSMTDGIQAFNDLLVAHKAYLPQFVSYIETLETGKGEAL